MCANCLSTAEVVAGNLAVTAAVLKAPVHRLLADQGLVAAPDPVARDARTVAFLRRLDLDPAEILGAEAVAAADRWVASGAHQRRARAASARPIGSHRALAAQ